MGFCALPNQGFTGFGGVIGMCRAFLEPVAAGSLKAQHTIKNEIGTPFRGSLSHLFIGTVLQQPLLILFYIFSGTLILNMVSTLKITFFTPMHRARRACCTAGSAPWMRQLP